MDELMTSLLLDRCTHQRDLLPVMYTLFADDGVGIPLAVWKSALAKWRAVFETSDPYLWRVLERIDRLQIETTPTPEDYVNCGVRNETSRRFWLLMTSRSLCGYRLSFPARRLRQLVGLLRLSHLLHPAPR
jgi:hypothetical protein